jgi:hypothetical protein
MRDEIMRDENDPETETSSCGRKSYTDSSVKRCVYV